MPVVLRARPGGDDPESLAKIVGYDHAFNSCERARGDSERNEEPVVGIDESKFHQQQMGQISCGRCDASKICLAIFHRPPTWIRHAFESDRSRNERAYNQLFLWRGGVSCSTKT